MVGIVTTRDGEPLENGQIAGRNVEGHNNFQDFDKFLEAGGNRGLQQQFGVRGYPTCWFVKPEKMSDGKMNLTQLGSKGYEAGGPANWISGANTMIHPN